MRRYDSGMGAAPAPVFRKHWSGRLRVTVRPYYEGPPFSGLVGTGGRRRKPADPEVEGPPIRS